MEDDSRGICKIVKSLNFNPRPPHGGRLGDYYIQTDNIIFQPTSSAWRTTAKINKNQLISLYKTYKNIIFFTIHPELILKIIYKYPHTLIKFRCEAYCYFMITYISH